MANALALFGAGLGGGAKAYGKFKEDQTKFEQEEFAKNAEWQRKENFARFSYDLEASERARKAKNDEQTLSISQQNATTQAASQVAAQSHYENSDALASSKATADQGNKDRAWNSQPSSEYGKMPDGSIRRLTNAEAADKEIPRATAMEASEFASTQRGKMDANSALTKQGAILEDGINRMRKTDTSPEKMDQIEDAMRLTNIADPIKAMEVAYGKPKTIPTERWNAAIKAVVEANKLSNEDMTPDQFKEEVAKMVTAMGTQSGGAPAPKKSGTQTTSRMGRAAALAQAEEAAAPGNKRSAQKAQAQAAHKKFLDDKKRKKNDRIKGQKLYQQRQAEKAARK